MMCELNGTIKELNIDYQSGAAMLTFMLTDKQKAMQCYDTLRATDMLDIKVDKHREKRSLNANSYAWALMGKIGDVMRLSKEDVYLQMLKLYGQSEMISVKDGIPIGQYIKYIERAGESWLNGTLFKHYKVYKGSSEFTKEEMAIFLDGVTEEAVNLNIDVRTPEEIAKLEGLWGE